jgi:AsmA-like C-terminal region
VLKATGHNRLRTWLLLLLLAATVTVGAAIIVVMVKWPFAREKVAHDLGEATSTTVEIKSFSQTYFPPGCVAEDVTFRQDHREPPLMVVRRLTMQSSLLGLFREHLSMMRADGAHVIIPPLGSSSSWGKRSSDTIVDTFIADQSLLEFSSRDEARPRLKFSVHRFRIHDLGGSRPMSFETALTLPQPKGEVVLSGSVGPWKTNDFGGTRISGSYTLRQADLSFLRGVAGVLSSDGKFSGTFSKLAVEGATDTPDFEVTRSGHQQPLKTKFKAFVDARNGDVSLQEVGAQWGVTAILGRGIIGARPGQTGKFASLDFTSENGHIQDLLFPFVQAPRSPLNGPISFEAHVDIAPVQGPFLDKLVLKGTFGITDARFSNPKTQQRVDQGSARARGEKIQNDNEDPERVLSDLTGDVLLKKGRAEFSHLAFRVPGALASMSGTFDLKTEAVNLHGILRMQTTPAQATSGFKSFLVKIVSPFVKKDHPNAPLPVSITGTYHDPHYNVSLGSGKKQRHMAKK